MKVKLVFGRTLWDHEMTWEDIKIFEVEIPLDKRNPDGMGDYNALRCCWPESSREGTP